MTNVITSTTSATPTVLAPKMLGSADFLRLMTEQLKQQDPFAAHDNSQMIAQMAQMSASSATTEMSVTLKGIAQQLTTQTGLLQQLVATKPGE